MSEFEQTEDSRRLEDIDANEVSVVDHGANNRVFAVVKRAETNMAREKIDLSKDEEEDEESEQQSEDQAGDAVDGDASSEKDAEAPVAQDASQEPTEGAEGEEEAEADPAEADPADSDLAVFAELLPFLQSQREGAEGELAAQLDAAIEALSGEGEGEEGESEAEAEEEEKSDEGWEKQLDTVNQTLSSVSKAKEEDKEEEEEAAPAEKSEPESNFVSTEQFEKFATGVASALTSISTSMTAVSKSVEKYDSFIPVAKSADGVDVESEEVTVSKRDNDLFEGVIDVS